MGQGFETLARRRRRVGEVSREHEWADAADFAAKNNFVMSAFNAGQLDGRGEDARLEVDTSALQKPPRRSARGRSRVATRRSGRDKGRSRTRSKSFPRIPTNTDGSDSTPVIRGSRGSGAVGAIASPGMVTRSRARSRSRASARASARRSDAAVARAQPYQASYDVRARHAPSPFPVLAESVHPRGRQARSYASYLPQPLDPTGRKGWIGQNLGGAPPAQQARDFFMSSFDALAPTSPHFFPAF